MKKKAVFGEKTIAINWVRSGARAAVAVGSAIVLLAILYHGSAQAEGDAGDDGRELLKAVLEAAQDHHQDGWAYTRSLVLHIDAASNVETVTVVEKFDPSKPPGAQREVTKTHQEDGKITIETGDDMDTGVDVDRVVYADLGEIDFAEAELISDNVEEAVYKLIMNEGEAFGFGGAHFDGSSLTDDIYGELVIRKSGAAAPYVSEVRIRNGDKKGSLFFDIEELDLSYRFAPSPDGTTYLSQGFDLNLEMDVLIFIDIDIEISTVYSDYSYVGEYSR